MITGKKTVSWIATSFFVVFSFLIPLYFWLDRCSNHFSSTAFLKLIFAPMALHLVFQTLQISFTALAVIAVLAVGVAALVHSALKNFPQMKRATEFLFSMVWLLPTLFYVIVTWNFLRTAGLGDWLYSLKAVQVAWVIGLTPYVALGLLKVLADFDVRQTEAARTLGAHDPVLWRTLFLPRLTSALMTFLTQAMWVMLTSFSLVVLLGGGSPQDTLETGIYQSVRFMDQYFDRAFALAFWQIVLMSVLLLIRKKFTTKTNVGLEWGTQPAPQLFSTARSLPVLLALMGILFGFLSTGQHFQSTLREPLVQAMALAAAVTAGTMLMAGLLYFTKKEIASWGAVISPLLLALAWWSAYGSHVSPWILCIGVQIVLFLPWVSRTLFPLLDRKRQAELDAACTLGATPARAWLTVEWPRIAPDLRIIAAWIMGFSMAEVSSVILFSNGEFEPIAVWSQNQIARFRFEEGFAGIKLVVLTTFLILFLATYLPMRQSLRRARSS